AIARSPLAGLGSAGDGAAKHRRRGPVRGVASPARGAPYPPARRDGGHAHSGVAMIASLNAATRPGPAWSECRVLTCSILPVRMACNCDCRFCFSKSSVSALAADRLDWRTLDVDAYCRFARARGATRLVITGGGEPLLRPDDVVHLVSVGRRHFDEI